MALTNAERQRRYRRHQAGDHSLCDRERCDGTVTTNVAVTPVDTQDVDTPVEIPSETRGEKLIRESRAGLSPEHIVLLEEAGRIADRLDRLDGILRGDHREWMYIRRKLTSDDVRVILTGVLSEAREQATALRGLIAEITKAKVAAKPEKPAPAEGRPRGLFGLADELAPRRKTP